MEMLTLCRICLVENVRMHEVTDNHLQKIFEKLTNIPFITADSRPMLVCFFCYARLKQCYKFWQKCVEAEAVFTQMLDEEYERKPMLAELEFFGGFLKTPIEQFSIGGLAQQEDEREDKDDIEGELSGGCERNDDVEIKAEYHSDASEQEAKDDSYPGFEDNPYSQSDSEDDIPLTRMKTGVEQGTKKRRATKKEREARKKSAPVAKKPKLENRKENLEDTIPTKDQKNEQCNSKFIDRTKSSKFKSVTKIKEPVKSNPIIKPVICTNLSSNINNDYLKCHNRDINSDDIKNHGLNHRDLSNEKPHKCDVCQRLFYNKSKFKIHTRIHTCERTYKCDICQSSFNIVANLKAHIRISHTGERPYKCDICQRSFNLKRYLKQHIHIHTGERPYKCDICQRSFSQNSNLNKHIRLHTGDKPYKCDVCQRSFSQNGNLKKHIRKHNGERPYKCDICQSSFSETSSLKVHIRIHTGDKPYKCDACQKSFSQNSHLKKHIRKHTGERPYKCDICQRCFKEKRNLKNHVLYTHW